MQARKRHGCSTHRFLDPVPLFLASQPHSTAGPSPKRYEKRYEDRCLSKEGPNPRRFTYLGDKRCMLVSSKMAADFSRWCADKKICQSLSRPAPTALAFVN